MPTDKELYIEWKTQYPELSGADAARYLSEQYGLSWDSLRGRLSRANTPSNNAAVTRELANLTKHHTPSVDRQQAIISDSHNKWQRWNTGGIKRGVFLSDIHLPYTRWDAYELAIKIMEDIKPDIVTNLNDCLDNTGYGRWEDDRPLADKIWDSDVVRVHQLHLQHTQTINSLLNTNGIQVGVAGNHDNWWYAYKRRTDERGAEKAIADYMQGLHDNNVLLFERGYRENSIELGDGLVLWHGQFASKSSHANAKKSIEQFMIKGQARSIIVGHTHRPSIVSGSEIGYNGVTFVNNGCLTDHAPYMKRNPVGWGFGITYFEYDPNGFYHRIIPINFMERNNILTAFFEGREYSVKNI